MKTSQQTRALSDNIIASHRLITGLRNALDMNYSRVLAAAKAQWERNFEGKDPSDACVSVRISSGKPLAGILKKPARSFLHGSARFVGLAAWPLFNLEPARPRAVEFPLDLQLLAPFPRHEGVPAPAKSSRAVVFLHQLADAIVRECIDVMTVLSNHALVRHQSVHDGFFGRLNGRVEQGVHSIVRHRLD